LALFVRSVVLSPRRACIRFAPIGFLGGFLLSQPMKKRHAAFFSSLPKDNSCTQITFPFRSGLPLGADLFRVLSMHLGRSRQEKRQDSFIVPSLPAFYDPLSSDGQGFPFLSWHRDYVDPFLGLSSERRFDLASPVLFCATCRRNARLPDGHVKFD